LAKNFGRSSAHYEANKNQAEAQMAQDDAEVRRWSSEAAMQEQLLRGEVTEVLRSRLREMQSHHLVAEGEKGEADRTINRAIQEALKN
jgi:hypothetical protein